MDAIKLLTYFFKQLSHLNLLSGIRILLFKKTTITTSTI